MIRVDNSLMWMPVMLALTATAGRASIAETNGNPYQVIVERNAFGLKPPAPPPTVTNKPPEVHNIKFTGISHDGGGKKAYLMSADPPKAGQPAAVEYYCLGEGQKQGEIEVKQINETDETVTVLKGLELLTLNFKDHGNTASAPPAQPGLPGMPAPGAPTPPVIPAYNNRYVVPGANPTLPVSKPGTAVYNAAPGTANVMGTADPSTRTIPTRPMRVQSAPGAPPEVDPAAQAALMLMNSQINAARNFPPLPPILGGGPR
ncbi:MAG: hypothetical protein ACYDH9_05130 [Limisphaerales bacterium]